MSITSGELSGKFVASAKASEAGAFRVGSNMLFREADGLCETEGKSPTRSPATYFRWKIWVDRLLAWVLLIPVGVLAAIFVLLVRATSKGPGIFRQRRVGKNGRCFDLYKIRTMHVDAESTSGPVWALPGDPRVTPVGRLLRKLHLDELPQIINVLRGDMSFVGPRPERPEFVRVLSEAIEHYRERSLVRPGITGLSQINLPTDTNLTSVQRKVALDLDYIEHANLWLDIRLLICTGLRIFKLPEGFLCRILALGRAKLIASIADPVDVAIGSDEATPETILLQAAQWSSHVRTLDDSSSLLDAISRKKPR